MRQFCRSSRAFAITASIFLVINPAVAGAGTTIFVHAAATGANNGTSWADAFTDLQSALTAAQSGDAIWVAAGTYKPTTTTDRTISFVMKEGVSIYGGFAGAEDPANFELANREFKVNESVLSGDIALPGDNTDNSYHVVVGANNARLDGFTVRAGNANPSDPRLDPEGGGIILCSASPTIINNKIANNVALHGGGISMASSSPLISQNLITGNTAANLSSNVAGDGGGIAIFGGAPTIANNVISENAAKYDPIFYSLGGLGGGIYALGSSTATIANNTIKGNNALLGGGIYLDTRSAYAKCSAITLNNGETEADLSFFTIANNAIVRNLAGQGGGIWASAASLTLVSNNTVTANSASGSDGGGIYIQQAAILLVNTIVAFNTSGVFGAGTITMNNCVFGNTSYNYYPTDKTGTKGNISADPRFANPMYGDWHLQSDSPCLESGDLTWLYGTTDMDGQPRIQPVGGMVDIGADESDGTVWPVGPPVIVRVASDGSDSYDGSSWDLPKRTVQAGIDAASIFGGEVWVQAGTYNERIGLPAFVHVFGGFSGSEVTANQRDVEAHITILDGMQSGSVVSAINLAQAPATLDGFTIRNGKAALGGGIYCDNSSPLITNNTIMRNSTDFRGGGLYVSGGSPTIANNVITLNNAIINAALGFVGGGAIYIASGSPTIANNTIAANRAADHGGGLYVASGSPKISNTIIAFDSSGVYIDSVAYPPSSPTLTHNCVFGNTSYNYSGITDPTGINGNISADPRFVRDPSPGPDNEWGTADDDYGNLALRAGSPCIDAGDNIKVPADAGDLDGDGDTTEPIPFDLAGTPRFLDDPATADTGNGLPPIVDMGAFEFIPGTVNLVASVSRRNHGPAGDFDIPVPLMGLAREPRQNGDKPRVVLTFTAPPTATDGAINCGQEVNVTHGTCNGVSVSGNDLVIDMTFNKNACVTVAVSGIMGLTGDSDVQVITREADVNTNGAVNILDLQAIKNQLNQSMSAANFTLDVTCNGAINILDLQAAKNNLNQAASCP